jgi:hypothetical protein
MDGWMDGWWVRVRVRCMRVSTNNTHSWLFGLFIGITFTLIILGLAISSSSLGASVAFLLFQKLCNSKDLQIFLLEEFHISIDLGCL